jgi:hypothetical protein
VKLFIGITDYDWLALTAQQTRKWSSSDDYHSKRYSKLLMSSTANKQASMK